MQVKDLVFNEGMSGIEDTKDTLLTCYTDAGRITVLNRLTGWGDGDIRDTETGFQDARGEFWLASGGFDIRDFPELTVEEAVAFIKSNANTCIGMEATNAD